MFSVNDFGGEDDEISGILKGQSMEYVPDHEDWEGVNALLDMCGQTACHVLESRVAHVSMLRKESDLSAPHIPFAQTVALRGSAGDMFLHVASVVKHALPAGADCIRALIHTDLNPNDTGRGSPILVDMYFYFFTRNIAELMSQLSLQ